MENKLSLTEKAQQKLVSFFDSHDITLLSRNLRKQFLDYLDYELRTAVPIYFDQFLYPFNELLDLLELIGDELNAVDTTHNSNKQLLLKNTSAQEKVIAFLKATIAPEKIFLLHEEEIPNRVGNDGRLGNDGRVGNDGWVGNNEEDYTSCKEKAKHFDLLVVIPDSAQTKFNSYEQVINMANIAGVAISVSLHQASALYQQLAEGHIYYSIVCNEENMIYDNGLTALPETDKTMLQGVYEKAHAIFYSSYKKANSFLKSAHDHYAAHDNIMAAFMLHQTIELALRGMITALLGSCAKTHCFKDLKKPLKRCTPELQYIISNNEEEENRLLHLLEKAYLESRYSDVFEISDNDVALLIDGAKKLIERVEAVFKKSMELLIDK